ncbi:uncharacterized protein F4822DRAFT_388116, partial [Hypoxylon trugodes]|uniref:uncharacterized protein n=1 Tax=Hypoxylon trugodes TaxID=326681 RepID=UPI00219D4AB9
MGRAKRPYVPKAKGCYECSQRRIHCDRGEPNCDKCVSRGLECSGITGKRHRFRNGYTPKRKNHQSSESGYSSSASPNNQDGRGRMSQVREDRNYSTEEQDLVPTLEQKGNHLRNPLNEAEDGLLVGSRSDAACLSLGLLDILALDHIVPWQRYLLKHFSEHIAPEMVIIDDHTNGWRYLVLPLACTDELVLSSVLTVAAFHHSRRTPGPCIADPAVLYSKTIYHLQRRSDLQSYDLDTRYHIVITMLVLLLATMVNGDSDFVILFRMLQSALDIAGGEEALAAARRKTAEFCSKQVRKMRVYASPFISQDIGIRAITAQAHQCWDDQEDLALLCFDRSHTLPLISYLREIAFQIYLQQACGEPNDPEAPHDLLSNFRLTLELLPESAEGERVLIWPVFIAASASSTLEERDYFVKFLKKQFSRSRFVNIIRALESLEEIWVRGMQENWTKLLSEQKVFV